MSDTFVPELLAPAGSLSHVKYAFAYGADAVYAGQPRYSLRVRNNEFSTLEALAEGINYAHARGKKFYVVSNIAPHNSKIKTYLDDMAPLIELGPDALIMSDPGLIMMVRDQWPDMPIHLSVQANAVNYKTVEFWQRQGLERVILSRELSVKEIEEIRQACPDMEIEVFVHGALCIAYSGRCLLSGYMNRRDPNQGTCTNACRWNYEAHEAEQNDAGDIVVVEPEEQVAPNEPVEDVVLLQEAHRPDDLMPAFEDEHGTYIMNSKDLRAIEQVQALTDIGVHSLKIEGRTKSDFYVARTVQAYRAAIDAAVAGEKLDPQLVGQLDSLANRGYTEGFLQRHRPQDLQNYEYGHSKASKQQYVGEVIECDEQIMLIEVKNKFQLGDQLELMTPSGNVHFTLDNLSSIKNEAMEVAPGSGYQVRVNLPADVDASKGLLLKDLDEPLYS